MEEWAHLRALQMKFSLTLKTLGSLTPETCKAFSSQEEGIMTTCEQHFGCFKSTDTSNSDCLLGVRLRD